MSILQNSNAISAGGYTVNNSLRFRSSASSYLNRTPASAGNRQIMTYSFWVKRGAITGDYNITNATTDGSNSATIYFNSSNNQSFDVFLRVGATNYSVTTSQVFRDPSAWYHIVVAIDTTQATASNRTKVYVNGSQVTALLSASYVPQNSNLALNNNVSQLIGGTNYFDGYMAEFNFIDGQQLTPSSFGETDTTTGVWKPKAYTGTYGTNGFYLPFGTLPSATYAGSFSGSNYLTMSAPANLAMGTGDFTIEFWYYQNSYVGSCALYDTRPTSTQGAYNTLYMAGGGYLYYSVNSIDAITSSSTLNNGQWYHIAVTRSGTSTKLFINGTQSGSTYTDTTNYASVGTNRPIIGGNGYIAGYYMNGYISNLRVVKGTALYTSTFVPPSAALTAISGTQLLTLQGSTIVDNSTNGYTITNNGSVTTSSGQYPYGSLALGKDSSGNGNNWATNNINGTTTGTTYDAMIDSPTNASASGTQPVGNYATLNPLSNLDATTLAAANLNLTLTTNSSSVFGTMGVSSGKWYWEIVCQDGVMAGVADTQRSGGTYPGNFANSCAWNTFYSMATNLYQSGTFAKNGSPSNAAATAGQIIGVALDMDAGNLYYYVNGTVANSGNAVFNTITGTVFPVFRGSTTTSSVNFGQRPFNYTPPTGFKALCTTNLPDSTIVKGNSYMDATLYTGNGANRSITNAGSFSPDLVWGQARSAAYGSWLFDTVRGATKQIESFGTNAESTQSTMLTAFNSDGFSMGTDTAGNNSGTTYVAWQWDAGSSTVTNTSGTISSQVRANTTAGVSIQTWTGTGANATVGHGLGVAPKMVMMKRRNSTGYWSVYHAGLTSANYVIYLNSTDAQNNDSAYFNGTAPTSTVFSLGSNSTPNASGGTYVSYCFAEIAGFSKFGSYTGNGSNDGPFIYTGFRPKYIMRKCSSNPGYGCRWEVLDTTRSPYNQANANLSPNYSNAEDSTAAYWGTDILSNGFKLRNTDTEDNVSGQTYIYMAFAENPFKNALAR